MASAMTVLSATRDFTGMPNDLRTSVSTLSASRQVNAAPKGLQHTRPALPPTACSEQVATTTNQSRTSRPANLFGT